MRDTTTAPTPIHPWPPFRFTSQAVVLADAQTMHHPRVWTLPGREQSAPTIRATSQRQCSKIKHSKGLGATISTETLAAFALIRHAGIYAGKVAVNETIPHSTQQPAKKALFFSLLSFILLQYLWPDRYKCMNSKRKFDALCLAPPIPQWLTIVLGCRAIDMTWTIPLRSSLADAPLKRWKLKMCTDVTLAASNMPILHFKSRAYPPTPLSYFICMLYYLHCTPVLELLAALLHFLPREKNWPQTSFASFCAGGKTIYVVAAEAIRTEQPSPQIWISR